MTISYAIPVWNEHEELSRLLAQLFDIIDPDDEICVQGDQGKVTDKVISVLHPYKRDKRFTYIEYPLNKDFATYKNNLFKHCSKDYIFQIDADEKLADMLAFNIKEILMDSPNTDCFAIPRKNVVHNITKEYAAQQGWQLLEVDGEIINSWPDRQWRLFKNHIGIFLAATVHEQLFGMKNVAHLPIADENNKPCFDWCLLHYKSIDRQIKQNNFYNTFK